MNTNKKWEDRIEEYLRVKSREEVIGELKKYYKKGYRYVVRDFNCCYLSLFSIKPKRFRDLESWGYANPNAHGVLMAESIKNYDITEINYKNRSATLIADFIKRSESNGDSTKRKCVRTE